MMEGLLEAAAGLLPNSRCSLGSAGGVWAIARDMSPCALRVQPPTTNHLSGADGTASTAASAGVRAQNWARLPDTARTQRTSLLNRVLEFDRALGGTPSALC